MAWNGGLGEVKDFYGKVWVIRKDCIPGNGPRKAASLSDNNITSVPEQRERQYKIERR